MLQTESFEDEFIMRGLAGNVKKFMKICSHDRLWSCYNDSDSGYLMAEILAEWLKWKCFREVTAYVDNNSFDLP